MRSPSISIYSYACHLPDTSRNLPISGGGDALPKQAGFVCLQSALCEGRYRRYVASYVAALLLGSLLYDRASQFDRAFLVLGLLATNVICWVLLALSEPNAPGT